MGSGWGSLTHSPNLGFDPERSTHVCPLRRNHALIFITAQRVCAFSASRHQAENVLLHVSTTGAVYAASGAWGA